MTCCPANPGTDSAFTSTTYTLSPNAVRPAHVPIPAGIGLLGTSQPFIRSDGEGPLRKSQVSAFSMSQGAISNAEFTSFVADTNYITEAEHLGWSFVFWNQVPVSVGQTQAVPGSPWWRRVDGASWQRITGPNCSLVSELSNHPVVHVSWNDARAYCTWVGGRLPTELEWEHAARGGLDDVRFPWGDKEPDDENNLLCNVWQGHFPQTNTAQDGYPTTAPVLSFEPNGYGLYNMVGNVWDWTADPFRRSSNTIKPGRQNANPKDALKLAKGGSFLCHKSYCYRYRIAARIGNSIDSATTHMGFRVVWDKPKSTQKPC